MTSSPLVLGPMMRYVDETSASIWVETRSAAWVSVRAGGRDWAARTFAVHGHHYALVEVDGLEPGTVTPYTLDINGSQVWPDPAAEFPPSMIATLETGKPLRMAFGSCRTSVPHDKAGNRTHGVDSLRAYALKMASGALTALTATSASPIMDDFTGTRIELHGTGGYLILDGDELRVADLAEGPDLTPPQLPPAPAGSEEIVFGSGHVYELMDFVRTVRAGGTAPIPGTDGRHLMAVIDAAYRSAFDRKAVDIDEPTTAYRVAAPEDSLLGSAIAGV